MSSYAEDWIADDFRFLRFCCILGVQYSATEQKLVGTTYVQQFQEYLASAITAAGLPSRSLDPGECQSNSHKRCNLCHAVALTYDDEVGIKNKALQQFWNSHFKVPDLKPLVPSALGRAYRTITKRKIFAHGTGPRLGLIDPAERELSGLMEVGRCAIEPPDHARIYSHVQESLEKPYARPLTAELRYVVIKGNYREFTVIFSVQSIRPNVVKALNVLSKGLTRVVQKVAGVFVYEDDSNSRYYLGTKNQRSRPNIRKIFGKAKIYQRIGGRTFLYSPLSFSQVNLSMVEQLVATASGFLRPRKHQTLYDLYCGYGLFALSLAERVKRVVGVEMSPQSIAAAKANATRQHVSNARFIRSNINLKTLPFLIERASRDDIIILDPPRGGTSEGVIEYIAAGKFTKVLHLFCDIDLMPSEIGRWLSSGYKVVQAVPLDMFPGTSTIETMVLLEPS